MQSLLLFGGSQLKYLANYVINRLIEIACKYCNRVINTKLKGATILHKIPNQMRNHMGHLLFHKEGKSCLVA